MKKNIFIIKYSLIIICSAMFLLSCSSNLLIPSPDIQTALANIKIHNKTKDKERKLSYKNCESIHSKNNINNLKTNRINIRIKKNLAICNVRPEPSFKKKSFAKLKGGDVVEKIKEKGTWIKIDFYESKKTRVVGWIRNSDIETKEKIFKKNKIKLAQAKIKKDIDTSEDLEQLSPM